jgi:Tfp pilus assembly protein PilO
MINIRFDKKMIIMVAGVAIAIVAFVLMVVPLFNKIHQMEDEAKALESEMASARQVIQSQGKFQQTGNLLTRQKISIAIDEITKMGAKQNINFLSISPQRIGTPQGSKYPVLPIRMDLQSEYKDLGLFLGSLEGLKESIVTVKNFQVEVDQQVLPQIKIDLILEVYLQEGEDG